MEDGDGAGPRQPSPAAAAVAGAVASVVSKALTRECCEGERGVLCGGLPLDHKKGPQRDQPPLFLPLFLFPNSDPIDTLKAQLQVAGAVLPSRSASAAMVARQVCVWEMRSGCVFHSPAFPFTPSLPPHHQILATDGPRGFYRGLGAVILGPGPASAVYFGAAEAARSTLPRLGVPPPAIEPLVGVVAQLAAGAAFTPVDVIKERLQAGRLTGGETGGTRAAVAAALRSGGPASLLRGYWVTNAVWLPWSALYFAFYSRLKEWAGGGDPDTPLPPLTQLSVGAAAAAAASLATHPLDVIKTRTQVLSASDPGLTARAAAVAAWRREGARAFWAGAGPRAAQLAAATGLQWLVYERARTEL